MAKVTVAFINTCPCCDKYGRFIHEAASRHGDAVEVTIYHAGKDFDYVRKYGPVTKGTLFVNGRKYDLLSKEVIERAISQAVEA